MPTTCYRLSIEADDRDEVFWAIVHSHTHSPARPSPTDIGQARSYPDALWILVSLAEAEADPATGEPGIRAWQIIDGELFEVGLTREPVPPLSPASGLAWRPSSWARPSAGTAGCSMRS